MGAALRSDCREKVLIVTQLVEVIPERSANHTAGSLQEGRRPHLNHLLLDFCLLRLFCSALNYFIIITLLWQSFQIDQLLGSCSQQHCQCVYTHTQESFLFGSEGERSDQGLSFFSGFTLFPLGDTRGQSK